MVIFEISLIFILLVLARFSHGNPCTLKECQQSLFFISVYSKRQERSECH